MLDVKMAAVPALLIGLVVLLPACFAVPKKYESSAPASGGFLPSPVSFYQQSGDQLAMESTGQSPAPGTGTGADGPTPATPSPDSMLMGRSADQEASASVDGRPQEPRFGFVGYNANGVQVQDPTYGTAVGPYGALRLDLGGVLLGALIGLGASLVLPKLIHGIAAHPHDGYKRSEESEAEGVVASLSHVLSRVDTALAEHNIDSSACLKRAVCSYVQSSATRSATGDASSVEAVVDSISRNSLVSYMLEGSSFKQAVDTGRKGGNCSKVFYKCQLNQDSLTAGLKSIISATS